MEKKYNLFLIGMILGISILIGFVFASVLVITSTGTSSYAMNNNTNIVFNISVNNSYGTTLGNISLINITLPANLSYSFGSNGTGTTSNFTNATSTNIYWNQTTGLILANATQFFSFNATSVNRGSYF